jgi:hypothetical protein
MTDINIPAINATVLWATFAVAIAFGYIGNRSNFCTMGAISDVMNIGDWTRLRMWAAAIGVAILAMGVLAFTGVVKPTHSIYTAPKVTWLSYAVGGLMFGFGMVLASGCGSKTLFRIGGGSLKSLVVFFMLGFASFATLKGITAVLRVNTVDKVGPTLATPQDLPSIISAWFDTSPGIVAIVLAGLIGGSLLMWAFAGKDFRSSAWSWLGGIGIGACVAAVWFISGKLGYVAEHPDTLQEAFVGTNSGRMESLTFVAPIAHTLDWFIFYSDKSKVLTLGVMSVFGTVFGSWLAAVTTKTFRWESFRDAEDVANHMVGGLLMGVGGVTALGCTIGQALTGLSTLALGSFIATAGIVAGAVLAMKYQIWRLEKQA